MMMVLDALIREFNGQVLFRERRPRMLQVLEFLFHESGDLVGVWIPRGNPAVMRLKAFAVSTWLPTITITGGGHL